ncbi:MAG: hypothetical protein EOO16_23015 [Chitinophagaceae bacterium]|nr:MAG: hypothetical protein EOO16_23015 [Chitinophagaceae bacterium]
MKKFSIPALTLLLLAGAQFACKKSNTGDLNGTYQSNGAMSVGPLRMYVSGSVLTDTSVTGPYARRYVTGNLDPSMGFLPGASSATMPFTYKVTINNLEGTIFFEGQAPVTVDIRHTPERLLLAARDSSAYYYNSSDDRCGQLLRRVTLDHSDSACYVMPVSSLSNSYCRYRDVFPLEVAGSTLNVPTMILAINSNGCVRRLINAWGRFDPAVATMLQAGDTILVQERTLPLYEQ